MKTLTNLKTTVNGNKVTIEADLVDVQFGGAAQQHTMLHHSPINHRFVRHAQLSNQAFFIKRMGSGLALPVEEWIQKVAIPLEPMLTHEPVDMKTDGLTVQFAAELEPSLQWQVADSPQANPADWKDIPEQNQKTLVPTGELKGKFVRCQATHADGQRAAVTPPVQIK